MHLPTPLFYDDFIISKFLVFVKIETKYYKTKNPRIVISVTKTFKNWHNF